MEAGRTKAEVSTYEILDEYLDPAYQYRFLQNPDVVHSREDARRDGINCVSLAHLVLKDMSGYELPSSLGLAELYLDREHFTEIESVAEMRTGDLVWFGLQNALKKPEEIQLRYDKNGGLVNWREYPVKHVAIFTGLRVGDDPLLLHATYVEGRQNKIWPLSKFPTYLHYRKLYGLTRLVAPLALNPKSKDLPLFLTKSS